MADKKLSPAHIAQRIAARRASAVAAAGTTATPATPRSFNGSFSGTFAPRPAAPGRMAGRPAAPGEAPGIHNVGDWRRECFLLPPGEARETARAWLARYPQARWRSEIENWRIVGDDLVQLTMRRLPLAE